MSGRFSPFGRLGIATRLVLLFGAVACGMMAVAVYLDQRAARQVAALERLNGALEQKRLLLELETTVAGFASLLDARQSLVLNQDFAGMPALKRQIATARESMAEHLDALSAQGDVGALREAIAALEAIHDQYLRRTIQASFVPAARAQRAVVRQRAAIGAMLAGFSPEGVLDLSGAQADLDGVAQDVGLTIGLAIPAIIALAVVAFLMLLVSVVYPLRRLTAIIDRLDAPEAGLEIPEQGPVEFRAMERALAALRDRVRAQRLAEQRAVRSAEKLQQFTEATSDVLWEMGPDLRFNWMVVPSARQAEIRARTLGRTRWEVAQVDPDTDPHWGRHRDTMMARRPVRDFEYQAAFPDGGAIWWRVSGVPLYDAQGRFAGYRGTAIDITEQKRFEEQLRRSQSMEMLGRLTSGVAHDFNNLLTVLSSNLEVLAARAELSAPFDEMVARCERATRRGRRLTRQLLSLGQKAELRVERIDLEAMLREFCDLLGHTLPGAISVELRCGAGLGDVAVDPGLLQDALLNLVVNARDAMPGGGRLTIEARGLVRGLERGDGVAISVRDTGIGIDPAVRERMFEPFFTTKASSQGTGLGLSMVNDFARRSGGVVEVESALGEGTAITMILRPGAMDAPAPAPAAPDRPAATVLLVEDDGDLRETLATILQFLGHRPVAFADIAAARAAVGTLQAGAAAVLLCRVAPEEAAEIAALAAALRARRPGAGVLLMAEGALDGTSNALVSDLGAATVRLPVATEAMGAAITACLARSMQRVTSHEDPDPR